MQKKQGAFSLGRVIVPASDGTLADLGFDVRALGTRALGVVMEARNTKAQIKFPHLSLNLWLAHSEMADVVEEVGQSRPGFARLVPDFSDPAKVPLVFWVQKLVEDLPVIQVHALETGTLTQLWNQPEGQLEDYFTGDANVPAAQLSLGVTELILKDWEAIRARLGETLLFARFLPAGMHRLDLSFYLKLNQPT